MARIQVLPLPAVKLGSAERMPYILVIDQLGDRLLDYVPAFDAAAKERVGAEGVILFDGTLDVA